MFLSRRIRRLKIFSLFLLIFFVLYFAGSALMGFVLSSGEKRYVCQDVVWTLKKDVGVFNGKLFLFCEDRGGYILCDAGHKGRSRSFLVYLKDSRELYMGARVEGLTGDRLKEVCFTGGLAYSQELDMCLDYRNKKTCLSS